MCHQYQLKLETINLFFEKINRPSGLKPSAVSVCHVILSTRAWLTNVYLLPFALAILLAAKAEIGQLEALNYGDAFHMWCRNTPMNILLITGSYQADVKSTFDWKLAIQLNDNEIWNLQCFASDCFFQKIVTLISATVIVPITYASVPMTADFIDLV